MTRRRSSRDTAPSLGGVHSNRLQRESIHHCPVTLNEEVLEVAPSLLADLAELANGGHNTKKRGRGEDGGHFVSQASVIRTGSNLRAFCRGPPRHAARPAGLPCPGTTTVRWALVSQGSLCEVWKAWGDAASTFPMTEASGGLVGTIALHDRSRVSLAGHRRCADG
jgi:hypothetical protein